MNIEDLSKSQLLMLMVLVNFIVSIGTGVLTVSLLDQAPTTVTQTVNRIVDHTIETVATGTPLASILPTSPATVTKTIIQHDDTLLPAAVAAAVARAVEIYPIEGTSSPQIAHGTYIPKARAVVATNLASGLPSEVTIVFPDGSAQRASLSRAGATITIYGFGDAAKLPAAPSPTIINHADLKQGTAVVAITSDGSAVTGIISKVDDSGVHMNLPEVVAGNTAVNLNGDIVGISTGSAGLYIPADKITTLLTATSTTGNS